MENRMPASKALYQVSQPRFSVSETMVTTEHATKIGANAIIGARYDATELGAGITEVLAYGTAVIAEPTAGNDIYQ